MCELAPEYAAAGVTRKPGAATLNAIASKAEVRNMNVSCGWHEVDEHPARPVWMRCEPSHLPISRSARSRVQEIFGCLRPFTPGLRPVYGASVRCQIRLMRWSETKTGIDFVPAILPRCRPRLTRLVITEAVMIPRHSLDISRFVIDAVPAAICSWLAGS
jgi:hypothetical protein